MFGQRPGSDQVGFDLLLGAVVSLALAFTLKLKEVVRLVVEVFVSR